MHAFKTIVIHNFWYRQGIQMEKIDDEPRKRRKKTYQEWNRSHISLHNHKPCLRCLKHGPANCQKAPPTCRMQRRLSAVTLDWNSIYILWQLIVFIWRVFAMRCLITWNARTRSQCQIYC